MSVQQNLYPIPLHCSKHPPLCYPANEAYHDDSIHWYLRVSQKEYKCAKRYSTAIPYPAKNRLYISSPVARTYYCSIPVYRRRELRLQYSSADESASDCWMHNLHKYRLSGNSKQHGPSVYPLFPPTVPNLSNLHKSYRESTFRGISSATYTPSTSVESFSLFPLFYKFDLSVGSLFVANSSVQPAPPVSITCQMFELLPKVLSLKRAIPSYKSALFSYVQSLSPFILRTKKENKV